MLVPLSAAVAASLAPSPQDVFGEAINLTRNIGSASAFAIADIDGDASKDLVVLGGLAGVVLDIDDLNSRAALGLATTGGSPNAVAAGDLDMDGRDEVVVQVTSDAGAVTWQVFDSVDGGQSFGPSTVSSAQDALVSAEMIDVDGDGDDDLVGERAADGLVVWYENVAGSLGSTATVVSLTPLLDLQLLDVDGDGSLDVTGIHETSRRVVVHLSVPGGGFGPEQRPALPAVIPDIFYPDYLLVDHDGDGDQDFLQTVGPRLQLYVNEGALSFASPVTVQQLSDPDRFLGLLDAADFDGDGDVDVLAQVGRLALFLFGPAYVENDGGTLQAPELDMAGLAFPTPRDFVGDVNGDGLADRVFIGSAAVQFAEGEVSGGDLVLNPAVSVVDEEPNQTFGPITLADLDGDGDDDLIAAGPDAVLQAFPAAGRGEFSGPVDLIQLPTPVFWAAAGDLDGDGDEDLVAVEQSLQVPVLLESDGSSLSLFPAQLAPAVSVAPGDGELLQVVDVDGDGDLDITLLVLNGAPLGAGQVTTFLNDGTATGWTAVTHSPTASNYALVDIDMDGTLDLLTSRPALNRVEFSAGLGNGSYGPAQAALQASQFTHLADLDGDGLLDVVDELSDSYALRNPGSPTFGPIPAPLAAIVPGNVTRPVFEDFDLDGRVDILTRNFAGGFQSAIYFAGSGLVFGLPVVLPDEISSVPSLYADADGDGDVDAFSMNAAALSSNLVLLRGLARAQTGESVCGPAVANSSGTSARMLAFGSNAPNSADLELRTVGVPRSTFGIYAASRVQAAPTPLAGSAGLLCLGGAIGRYDGPGQILSSGAAGEFDLVIDPAAIEQPNGTVAAQAGETWYFQAWFRDVVGGQATSNLSDALAVSF